jgi:hypothetical protein
MKIILLITLVVTGVVTSNLPVTQSNVSQGKYSMVKNPYINTFRICSGKAKYGTAVKAPVKDMTAKKTAVHSNLSIKIMKPSGEFITFYPFLAYHLCRKPC